MTAEVDYDITFHNFQEFSIDGDNETDSYDKTIEKAIFLFLSVITTRTSFWVPILNYFKNLPASRSIRCKSETVGNCFTRKWEHQS